MYQPTEKISEVASRFGAEVYVRPKHLSQDSSLVIDCLRNLISRLKREKETANYLILLEPTSPLRNTKDIDLSIEKLLDFDSVATFCNAELNPHRAWKIKGNTVEPFINGAIPWLPRQQLPEAFQLNGAVYGFRIDKLPIDGQSIIFGNIAAIKMPIERSIDIDSMTHLKMAEHIIRGKMTRLKNLFSLQGKTALVAGGAGLLGGEIADALAEQGANLVIASRDIRKM